MISIAGCFHFDIAVLLLVVFCICCVQNSSVFLDDYCPWVLDTWFFGYWFFCAFNTYSYTTYSYTLTYSLSISCRPTYCRHAMKMTSLRTINNWLLNIFSRIFQLIYSPSPSLLNKCRFPFQNFFKFFDHVKCKNNKSFFFAINNSSLFNFTP